MAPCPVLLVPEDTTPTIRHIVVGVKATGPARGIVEAAAALARALGARVTLVNVLEPGRSGAAGQGKTEPVLRANDTVAGLIALTWTSQFCQQAGVPFETLQIGGEPLRTLLGVAEAVGADVVAVGRQTRRRPSSFLPRSGCVIGEALRDARCAVLVADGRTGTAYPYPPAQPPS
jgi:nucleotide-binding universal stress UspA family protein